MEREQRNDDKLIPRQTSLESHQTSRKSFRRSNCFIVYKWTLSAGAGGEERQAEGRVMSVGRHSETWPKNRSTLSPNSDFLIIFSGEEESLRFEILRRRSTKDSEGHGPRILTDALSQGDCELARPRTRRN